MTTESIVTTDLAKYGSREREMLVELLQAWRTQGLPKDFYEDEVQPMFNTHSGCVFLTNSEYQAAMMNGNALDMWYNCPYCGHEGFLKDMKHDPEGAECSRFMADIGAE